MIVVIETGKTKVDIGEVCGVHADLKRGHETDDDVTSMTVMINRPGTQWPTSYFYDVTCMQVFSNDGTRIYRNGSNEEDDE